MSKCILIAGLPNSGKSTFIAALWSCLEDKFDHMKMGMANLPEDCEYLSQLSSKWNELVKFDRSSSDNPNITMPLKANDTGEIYDLVIPDFRGETFLNLITTNSNEFLLEKMRDPEGMIYFIGKCDPGRFYDDFKTEETDDAKEMNEQSNVQFKLSDVPTDSLNMLVLKYLLAHYNFKSILICVSAFDEKGEDFTAKEYLHHNSPGLFNYLESLMPRIKYMGMSAQGCKYEDLNDEDKGTFLEKTQSGKRAYVQIDRDVIFDITFPIYSVLIE